MSEEYTQAQALEQFHRNCIYLGIPEIVCGHRIRNVTPRDLATLTSCKSPWIVGGNRLLVDEVFKTIWPLHVDYDPKDSRTAKRVLKSLYSLGVYQCVDELDAFFELTFMDALSGEGATEKPIAASVAWLIYTFREDPFWFSKNETLDTPLRELYQEMKCHRKAKGGVVMNHSDKIRGDNINLVNEWLQGDTSDTQEQRRERLRELRVHLKQAVDDPKLENKMLMEAFPDK